MPCLSLPSANMVAAESVVRGVVRGCAKVYGDGDMGKCAGVSWRKSEDSDEAKVSSLAACAGVVVEVVFEPVP